MTRFIIDLPDPEPAQPSIWAAQEVRRDVPTPAEIWGRIWTVLIVTLFLLAGCALVALS